MNKHTHLDQDQEIPHLQQFTLVVLFWKLWFILIPQLKQCIRPEMVYINFTVNSIW